MRQFFFDTNLGISEIVMFLKYKIEIRNNALRLSSDSSCGPREVKATAMLVL